MGICFRRFNARAVWGSPAARLFSSTFKEPRLSFFFFSQAQYLLWKEGLRDEWHLQPGVWAGHCGDDWQLTGPLWRILPVYREPLLIGCLESNFLLHVPVCRLAAWMSGWLAVAYTHTELTILTLKEEQCLKKCVQPGRNNSLCQKMKSHIVSFHHLSWKKKNIFILLWRATARF